MGPPPVLFILQCWVCFLYKWEQHLFVYIITCSGNVQHRAVNTATTHDWWDHPRHPTLIPDININPKWKILFPFLPTNNLYYYNSIPKGKLFLKIPMAFFSSYSRLKFWNAVNPLSQVDFFFPYKILISLNRTVKMNAITLVPGQNGLWLISFTLFSQGEALGLQN